MIRYWTVWLSPNAERVALALAFKGLEAERVEVPYDDRVEVERVSGQPYVPVLEHDGRIVFESEAILRYLEQQFPDPPLWPREPPRHAEADIFVEWFNRVWKQPFNQIYDELTRDEPDEGRVAGLGQRMVTDLSRFEALLAERPFLLGHDLSVADVVAFPFLKFGALWVEGDPYLHHEILRRWTPLLGHPHVDAWIRRVDARPRH